MSYSIIHKTVVLTHTAGYGYQLKALAGAFESAMTEKDISFIKTVDTESNSVYDVSYIINARYKIRVYNSSSTLYLIGYGKNFNQPGVVQYTNNASSVFSSSQTVSRFSIDMYVGDCSLIVVFGTSNMSTVAYGNFNGCSIMLTSCIDANDNEDFVSCSYSASSTRRFYGGAVLSTVFSNSTIKTPNRPTANTTFTASLVNPTDVNKLEFRLSKYYYNGDVDYVLPYFFKCPQTMDSSLNHLFEIYDTNDNLYVTSETNYLKI